MNVVQLSDLDLRLLRVLDVLLETSSVSQAAARLGVTPSAVSHSLRELRRRMGDPLFVRSGGALRPTDLALEIRPRLRSALVGLRHILDAAPGFDPLRTRRRFSLVMPDHLQQHVLTPVMKSMAEEAPNARVRIWPLGLESHAALSSGELDLVVTAGHAERFLSLDRDMMRARVLSRPLVCILRKEHPVLASGRWDAETYANLPHIFISLSGAERGVVDAALERLGLVRRTVLTLNGGASAVALVAATDLVSTIPVSFARQLALSVPIVHRDLPFATPTAEAYLWWHARFQNDEAHAWWRAKIAAAVRQADADLD